MSFRKLYEISFLLVLVFGILADQTPADLGLGKLEKKENFIKVTYKSETVYPNGFGNGYRNGTDHIKIGNETFNISDPLTIGANEAIEIHFKEPIKSLSNFFGYFSAYRTGDENVKKIISVDFTNFNSSKVEEVISMFEGCTSIEEINFNNFQTSGKIKDMSNMFYDCSSLKEIDLSRLVIPFVEKMEQIFANCNSLKFLDLSNLNLGKLNNANSMFNSLVNLEYINIYNVKSNDVFKTAISELNGKEGLMACQKEEIISEVISKCCSLYGEIDSCAQANYIVAKFNKDVSYPYGFGYIEYDKSPNKYRSEIYLIRNENNSTLANLTKFFYFYDDPNVEYLQSLNFAFFNSSLLESMDSTFYGCTSLESIYLTNFEAPLLTNMNSTFFHCSSLKFIDLSSIVSSSITSMNRIFCGCISLQTLVLRNLDMTNVEDAFFAFYNVKNLKYLDLFDIKTNDIFKNELLGEFGLNETNNTAVCQKEKIITNPNDRYMCYNLDIDCKCECSNNILVYYENESNYNESFISGIESRKFIKYIYINDDIYEANSPLYIKANSYVKLCFEKPISSLENFFNNQNDSNVVNIKAIDLRHFDSSLLTNMDDSFYGCNELIELDMSNFNFENLSSTEKLIQTITNLKYFVFTNAILNDELKSLFTKQLQNFPNLIPCHNNEYLQQKEVPSICCSFDLELGRCQQTNNYIIVTYNHNYLSFLKLMKIMMEMPTETEERPQELRRRMSTETEGVDYVYDYGFENNKTQRKSISFINYRITFF